MFKWTETIENIEKELVVQTEEQQEEVVVVEEEDICDIWIDGVNPKKDDKV